MKSLRQHYVDVCNDYLKSVEEDECPLEFPGDVQRSVKEICIDALEKKKLIYKYGKGEFECKLTDLGKVFFKNKNVKLTISDLKDVL